MTHEFDSKGKAREIIIWDKPDEGTTLSFMSREESLVIDSVGDDFIGGKIAFVVN